MTCFTQICKALYGNAIFVSLRGAQIWGQKQTKTGVIKFFYKKNVDI